MECFFTGTEQAEPEHRERHVAVFCANNKGHGGSRTESAAQGLRRLRLARAERSDFRRRLRRGGSEEDVSEKRRNVDVGMICTSRVEMIPLLSWRGQWRLSLTTQLRNDCNTTSTGYRFFSGACTKIFENSCLERNGKVFAVFGIRGLSVSGNMKTRGPARDSSDRFLNVVGDKKSSSVGVNFQ